MRRHTVVAHGRHAVRERRLLAARQHEHGLHILTFEQLAARLAGGLTFSVDDQTLRQAVQSVLPTLALGELDSLKSLPGMVAAAVETVGKAWRAGIDLQTLAASHPRVASLATLEAAVLASLPPAMMRPADLVAAALARLEHAPRLIGPVEVLGLTELAPCWRPLLQGMASCVPVRWIAGPRSVPAWLTDSNIQIQRAQAQAPQISSISASTEVGRPDLTHLCRKVIHEPVGQGRRLPARPCACHSLEQDAGGELGVRVADGTVAVQLAAMALLERFQPTVVREAMQTPADFSEEGLRVRKAHSTMSGMADVGEEKARGDVARLNELQPRAVVRRFGLPIHTCIRAVEVSQSPPVNRSSGEATARSEALQADRRNGWDTAQ